MSLIPSQAAAPVPLLQAVPAHRPPAVRLPVPSRVLRFPNRSLLPAALLLLLLPVRRLPAVQVHLPHPAARRLPVLITVLRLPSRSPPPAALLLLPPVPALHRVALVLLPAVPVHRRAVLRRRVTQTVPSLLPPASRLSRKNHVLAHATIVMRKETKTVSRHSPRRGTPTMNRTARAMPVSTLLPQEIPLLHLLPDSCARHALLSLLLPRLPAVSPCDTITLWHGRLLSRPMNGASPSSDLPEAISISRQKRAAVMLLLWAVPGRATTA